MLDILKRKKPQNLIENLFFPKTIISNSTSFHC